MSLDTEKLHRLHSKEFDKLYKSNQTKWLEMVKNAVEFASSYIKPTDILKGDLVSVLQNPIRIDKDFEKHTISLPQKYWVTWFAEYIIEQKYPQDKVN